MRRRIWLAALLIAGATPLAASEPLTLRLSQPAAAAPATVTVQVSVEPHADNRALEVVVDSDQYYRGSKVSLDGDEARRTHTFEFRNLPGGSYGIRAVLMGSTGKAKAFAESRIVMY